MEDKTALKEHLKMLEEKLLQMEVRTSATEIDELLCTDFTEFSSSGFIYKKEDCLTGMSLNKMTLSDFDINLLSSKTALTTYRVYDETRDRHTLRSSIWKFEDGVWRMFFHQGTITAL